MVENQAYLFLVFSFTGIIIGVLFDIFRVLRRNIKTADIITYIEDILFWVLTGILILYNIWYFNDGEIRIFMFLGIIMGILIYMLTLSNILIKVFSQIIKILKKLIKILELPLKPIKSIFAKIYNIIVNIFNKLVKKGKNFIKFENKRGKLEKNGE